MKIVRPYAKLMSPYSLVGEGMDPQRLGEAALRYIEFSSRISHRSEDKITDESWKRIIQSVVIDHGDWSVVEHVSVSVDALVDRGITHEWVRHRLFSYTQESTRFVNYNKEKDGKPVNPPSFIYPKPDVECAYCVSGNEVTQNAHGGWLHQGLGDCAYHESWLDAIAEVEQDYKRLLADKWRPQEARSVFPNALASRIIVTGNLRNWRHFFIMRTTQESHPQMRQVTIPLLKEFQDTFPLLFDDLQPSMKQSESMKKIR